MSQRSELMRLQMAADAKGTFYSQNVISHEVHNVERSSKRKANPSTNVPPPSHVGTSSKKKDASFMYGKLEHDDIDDAVGRFLFSNGIPFHFSHSPYYKEMVQALVRVGPSYVPPGETKLRTVVLEREVYYYAERGD